jgi:hypothetical protein
MISASSTVFASGFSQSTCLPASSAATATSTWVLPGEQMSTTSMSSRSIAARQSVSARSQPQRSADSCVRAWSRPTTDTMRGASGRSKNAGATRQACEWAAPMKPWPIIATPRAPPVSAAGAAGCVSDMGLLRLIRAGADPRAGDSLRLASNVRGGRGASQGDATPNATTAGPPRGSGRRPCRWCGWCRAATPRSAGGDARRACPRRRGPAARPGRRGRGPRCRRCP